MRFTSAVLMIGVFGLGFVSLSYCAEKKISRSELPAAVRKTAQDESQGAIVKGYSKEIENGRLEYEVEMTIDGHSRDVSIAPDGHVLEIEEQVQLNTLRANVQHALNTKAAKGKITKVESIRKSGKLVAYEAQVKAEGRDREIQVGPEGEALSHQE